MAEPRGIVYLPERRMELVAKCRQQRDDLETLSSELRPACHAADQVMFLGQLLMRHWQWAFPLAGIAAGIAVKVSFSRLGFLGVFQSLFSFGKEGFQWWKRIRSAWWLMPLLKVVGTQLKARMGGISLPGLPTEEDPAL